MKILIKRRRFYRISLIENLVKLGYNVKAFVLYNFFSFNGWIDALPINVKNKLEIFYGDLRDKFSINCS